MLQKNIEIYIKRYNIYLMTLKAICYKLYNNFQLLAISIH